jgi:hypothetical protein
MLPLPVPERGGSIEALQSFLNLSNQNRLCVGRRMAVGRVAIERSASVGERGAHAQGIVVIQASEKEPKPGHPVQSPDFASIERTFAKILSTCRATPVPQRFRCPSRIRSQSMARGQRNVYRGI